MAVPSGSDNPLPKLETTTTVELLSLAREGDETALNALFRRCLPVLRRWARGRLPRSARDLLDTQDVVQDTVLQTLRNLEHFEPRHEGALQAYLRQAVLNRIRDEVRKRERRPARAELWPEQRDSGASPLEQAIGRERLERYEQALQRLRPGDREAIVARFELQYDYEQLAIALDKPTANAARIAVRRALARLIEEMNNAI